MSRKKATLRFGEKARQEENTEQESTKQTETTEKKHRFGRLYIVTAVSTAAVCLAIILISAQVSRSVTQRLEKNTILLPTPMPVDSFLKREDSEAAASEMPTLPPPTAAPQITAEQSKETSAETDMLSEDSVAVGLFQKKEPFRLVLPLSGEVLNPFSENRLKKSKTLGDWRTHNGMDFHADIGTAVYAAADGVVVRAEYDSMMGYTVVLEHEEKYKTLYANLASAEMAEVGQNIRAGECLGAVGDSAVFEKAEASHLHFELTENGIYQNPAEYLP